MLKRLRFLFKAHRVQSDPGKFPRYDIYYGCINGKTVEPTSHYSTQTSKRAAQKCIFLMGSPGCGKTTTAAAVGHQLGLSVMDVDEYLENFWKTTVADKLSQLGDDSFLAAEGEALMQMTVPDNCIVSLSGSNPLHRNAMHWIRSSGKVIFLDVHYSDILARLSTMKVDCIVGRDRDMADNLQYRQQFYEGSYDARLICEHGEQPESVADKVVNCIKRLDSPGSKFVSTRSVVSDTSRSYSFSDVILSGGAPDGGLFVPADSLPEITVGELQRLAPLNYCDRAICILERLLLPCDVHPSLLRCYAQTAFSTDVFGEKEACGVEQVGTDEYILELFRGPTASFKDLSSRLLAHFLQHATSATGGSSRHLVLVATSGDTGSAVAHSFSALSDDDRTKVLILYPEHGVTKLQKLQLLDGCSKNVHAAAIDGDFDFCQQTVKRLLTDDKFQRELQEKYDARLRVANSINWGRLLGQIVFHISGYLDLVKSGAVTVGQHVNVCIPTGNFGNIMAAYYAKQMGLPVNKLICASNQNNVLSELINTGHYNVAARGSKAIPTISPAMDIVRASNVERYFYQAMRGNGHAVSQAYRQLENTGRFRLSAQVREMMDREFWADWCMDDTCLQTIRDTYQHSGYLADTHTGVGLAVARKFHSYTDSETPTVVCATAHYAKCLDEVVHAVSDPQPSVGKCAVAAAGGSLPEMLSVLEQRTKPDTRPAMHSRLRSLFECRLPPTLTVLPAQLDAIAAHIRSLL